MTISGSTTTIKDTAGNVTTSNIVDTSTRELATVAIAPGTVTVNYVDQYGNIIKTVDMPIIQTLITLVSILICKHWSMPMS